MFMILVINLIPHQLKHHNSLKPTLGCLYCFWSFTVLIPTATNVFFPQSIFPISELCHRINVQNSYSWIEVCGANPHWQRSHPLPLPKALYHLTTTCSDWEHALEWAVGISRCEFKGTTIRQSCDLAQGSALESPSGIKPSPSLPRSWLLPSPIFWHLEQVRDFEERNFFLLLCLLWTYHFSPSPLRRRPTALVPLPPPRKGM